MFSRTCSNVRGVFYAQLVNIVNRKNYNVLENQHGYKRKLSSRGAIKKDVKSLLSNFAQF